MVSASPWIWVEFYFKVVLKLVKCNLKGARMGCIRKLIEVVTAQAYVYLCVLQHCFKKRNDCYQWLMNKESSQTAPCSGSKAMCRIN